MATDASNDDTQLPSDFEVQIAALNQDEQAQVIDAMHAAAADGSLHDFNLDHAVSEAKEAQHHRENVEELHHAQADAVAHHDYAHAHDLAQRAEWQVHAVQDHGGEGDAQLAHAEADVQHLDDAQFQQQWAHEDAQWAHQDAQDGNAAHAAEMGHQAHDHSDSADDSASHAAEGGPQGDHSYDSDSTGDDHE